MKIKAPPFKTKLKAFKWVLHHINNDVDFGIYENKYSIALEHIQCTTLLGRKYFGKIEDFLKRHFEFVEVI